MLFGGIFKKWFGGGQRKHAARVRKIADDFAKSEEERLRDQNLGAGDPEDDAAANDPAPADPVDPAPETIKGKLALDRNNDSAIDPAADTAFRNDKPGATTNLEGLDAFDSNNDGLLDVSDPQFQRFGVWNDANDDGQYQSGEFETFAQLGIESIDLSAGLTNGLLSVTKTDGTQGLLALAPTV